MIQTPLMNIPYGSPCIGEEERQAVCAVLSSRILVHGIQGRQFAADFGSYIGVGPEFCVPTSSCMAALHLASIHFGFGPGDEIIVPAQTHVATVHAIELTGATPVFVDCRLPNGNLDPEQVAAAVTPRTRAISVVHFLGIPAPMAELLEIAQRHNLRVIEDCATAVGSHYRGTHVGLLGDIGCFSFYPTKHMTTGEGGMFVSRHAEIALKVERFRAFHVDRSHGERSIPGVYDVNGVGMNYRMGEMAAAIGCVQLTHIGEMEARRRHNFSRLKERIGAVDDVLVLDSDDSRDDYVPYTFSVMLCGRRAETRNAFARRLNEAGIGTSVHYPHPVSRLTYYAEKYGWDATRYPNATAISDRSINLPVAPHVNDTAVDYIADTFTQIAREVL